MKKIENRVLKATNKIEKSCAFGAIRRIDDHESADSRLSGFYCTYLVRSCYGYAAIYISWCK